MKESSFVDFEGLKTDFLNKSLSKCLSFIKQPGTRMTIKTLERFIQKYNFNFFIK